MFPNGLKLIIIVRLREVEDISCNNKLESKLLIWGKGIHRSDAIIQLTPYCKSNPFIRKIISNSFNRRV